MNTEFFISFISINLLYPHSCSLICARYIAIKQWYISYTNTNFPVITSIYSGILSVIEKALKNLVEEYQGIGKFLWNLVES